MTLPWLSVKLNCRQRPLDLIGQNLDFVGWHFHNGLHHLVGASLLECLHQGDCAPSTPAGPPRMIQMPDTANSLSNSLSVLCVVIKPP
jgi:hypothetical protein